MERLGNAMYFTRIPLLKKESSRSVYNHLLLFFVHARCELTFVGQG